MSLDQTIKQFVKQRAGILHDSDSTSDSFADLFKDPPKVLPVRKRVDAQICQLLRASIASFKDQKDTLESIEIKLQRKIDEQKRLEQMKKAEKKKYIAH